MEHKDLFIKSILTEDILSHLVLTEIKLYKKRYLILLLACLVKYLSSQHFKATLQSCSCLGHHYSIQAGSG